MPRSQDSRRAGGDLPKGGLSLKQPPRPKHATKNPQERRLTMTRKKHGPLDTAPAPPKRLPPDAKQVWNQVCSYMLNRQTLHSGDAPTIEAFCWAMARLQRLEAAIHEAGPFTAEGKPHPGIASANGTAAAVAKLAGALGLAPVSRARLTVAVQKGAAKAATEDDWLTVLPGGK